MANKQHLMLNCSESNRSIFCNQMSRYGELTHKKTCMVRSSDNYDFTCPGTGLKRSRLNKCNNFLLTEDSVLEFCETIPLEHSIFSCSTGFLYTDNFQDKKIIECNLTKNINKFLWISNQALGGNCKNTNYENDCVKAIPQKKTEKCVNFRIENKILERSPFQTNKNDCLGNENKVNRQVGRGLIYDTKRNRKVKIYGEKYGNTVTLTKRYSNHHCARMNVEEKDRQNDNSLSIADEYDSLSKISCSSKETCSQDSRTIVNGAQSNVLQVFCLNGEKQTQHTMPVLVGKCWSEAYISAEEPSFESSCECFSCPKSDGRVLRSENQGVQAGKSKNHREVTPNKKNHFISVSGSESETPSAEQPCQECQDMADSPCARYSAPPLSDTSEQRENNTGKSKNHGEVTPNKTDHFINVSGTESETPSAEPPCQECQYMADSPCARHSAPPLSDTPKQRENNTGKSKNHGVVTPNKKDHFINLSGTESETPSAVPQCQECQDMADSPCARHLAPPLLDNYKQRENNIAKPIIQEHAMESFSTLSMFFIMKDLNTGCDSYCKRQDSYRLLSTAMICLRVKNPQPKKKPAKSKIQNISNEKTRSCSDLPKQNCAPKQNSAPNPNCVPKPNSARTKPLANGTLRSNTPARCYKDSSDRKVTLTVTETPQQNNCKLLGVQTSGHKEKRHPRELNLLLSFHPDKNKDTKGCHPAEPRRSSPYRSYLQRQNPRTDKVAQACVLKQSACIQLSTTNTPTMLEKGNQFCPSKRSKCIQPTSSIYLRQSRATNYSRDSSDKRSRICKSQFSTESSLFYSPPPCALYLPDFDEASGQTFQNTPQTPFMIPMPVDLYQEISSQSLACKEVKKKYSRPFNEDPSRSFSSKRTSCLYFKEDVSADFPKTKASNPSENNYLDLGSYSEAQPACTSASFHTPKNSQNQCSATKASEGSLDILKLNQPSPFTKERNLLSSFGFKATGGYVCCDKREKEIQLIGEDFKNLKQAIEKFISL